MVTQLETDCRLLSSNCAALAPVMGRACEGMIEFLKSVASDDADSDSEGEDSNDTFGE